MIMSLKAASLGLNMVAACNVLLLDLWWNPTTEDQAIDRAHRIGQRRPVSVYRLTVKDTVEDRILALQVHFQTPNTKLSYLTSYGRGKNQATQLKNHVIGFIKWFLITQRPRLGGPNLSWKPYNSLLKN